MKLVVFPGTEGWQWQLQDAQGREVCSSSKNFRTAPLAFANFMSLRRAIPHAPIVDSAGTLEPASYEIHYVQ